MNKLSKTGWQKGKTKMYGLKKKYIEILKKHGCKCRHNYDDNNGWMYKPDIPISYNGTFSEYQ